MTFEPDPSEPRTLLSVLEYRASHSGAERFVVTPDYRERTYAEIMARAKRLGESLAQAASPAETGSGSTSRTGGLGRCGLCDVDLRRNGRRVRAPGAGGRCDGHARLAGCTFVVTTQDEESFTRVFRPFRVTDEGELAQEAPSAAAAAAATPPSRPRMTLRRSSSAPARRAPEGHTDDPQELHHQRSPAVRRVHGLREVPPDRRAGQSSAAHHLQPVRSRLAVRAAGLPAVDRPPGGHGPEVLGRRCGEPDRAIPPDDPAALSGHDPHVRRQRERL